MSVEDAEFAVVATDGVWAFVDDARAVDTVADALSKSDDVAAAAEALSTLARERAAASPRGVETSPSSLMLRVVASSTCQAPSCPATDGPGARSSMACKPQPWGERA